MGLQNLGIVRVEQSSAMVALVPGRAKHPCCIPPSSTQRHAIFPKVALALRGLGFFDVGRRFFALFALLSLLPLLVVTTGLLDAVG